MMPRFFGILLQVLCISSLVEGSALGLDIYKRSSTTRKTGSIEKSWADAVLYAHDRYVDFSNIGRRMDIKRLICTSTHAKRSSSLDTSVDVKIICKTCYIKSEVVATVTIDSGFNLTQAISSFADDFVTEVKDITRAVIKELDSVNITSFVSGHLPALPTINETLNFDNVTSIPETQIKLEFNGLELYMQVDLQLSAGATYTLHLYDSKTIVGVGQGSDRVGVVFGIDLVLSVDADVDISSGFHILMNDGFGFSLDLFEPDTDKFNMTM
jgi:hypothetical protein